MSPFRVNAEIDISWCGRPAIARTRLAARGDIIAGNQPLLVAVALDAQAIPFIFDFVSPVGGCGNLVSLRWNAEVAVLAATVSMVSGWSLP